MTSPLSKVLTCPTRSTSSIASSLAPSKYSCIFRRAGAFLCMAQTLCVRVDQLRSRRRGLSPLLQFAADVVAKAFLGRRVRDVVEVRGPPQFREGQIPVQAARGVEGPVELGVGEQPPVAAPPTGG